MVEIGLQSFTKIGSVGVFLEVDGFVLHSYSLVRSDDEADLSPEFFATAFDDRTNRFSEASL